MTLTNGTGDYPGGANILRISVRQRPEALIASRLTRRMVWRPWTVGLRDYPRSAIALWYSA